MQEASMWIERYQVRPSRGTKGFAWELWSGGIGYRGKSDRTMGSVVAMQRELVRMLAQNYGIAITPTSHEATSERITFDAIEIERSITQPGYRVYVESGKFSFTAYLDPTIESFLAVWSACMKFFAAKYGIVYLYDEVARNVEAAREQGFC
jgi:hypothetical protein